MIIYINGIIASKKEHKTMKYYYDFDMNKTFTEEELKEAYEDIKNDSFYIDFEDFIQCELMYMDEISEELFESIREKEEKLDIYYSLMAILMQELYENNLFNIEELEKKYIFYGKLKPTLTELYNEYFEEQGE